MTDYEIILKPDGMTEEVRVTLRGPGLDASGRHYVFRNQDRAWAFAEAVNFAYQQGLRDGERKGVLYSKYEYVVAGRLPEDIYLKPEGWWPRLRRLMRLA